MMSRGPLLLIALAVATVLAALAGCRSSLSYIDQGVEQLEAKDYDAAQESFSAAIDKDPDNDAAYFNRGEAHLALGRHDAAIRDYTRAIDLAEKKKQLKPLYLNRRGLAHYRAKHFDDALADWRVAKAVEQRNAARPSPLPARPDEGAAAAAREDSLADAERNAVQEQPPS